MISEAKDEIIVLSLKSSLTRSLVSSLASASGNVNATCIMPEGAESFRPAARGVKFINARYAKGSISEYYANFFVENERSGDYKMEMLMTTDERRSILLYRSNGERVAIVVELPLIALLQTSTLRRLIEENEE